MKSKKCSRLRIKEEEKKIILMLLRSKKAMK